MCAITFLYVKHYPWIICLFQHYSFSRVFREKGKVLNITTDDTLRSSKINGNMACSVIISELYYVLGDAFDKLAAL